MMLFMFRPRLQVKSSNRSAANQTQDSNEKVLTC